MKYQNIYRIDSTRLKHWDYSNPGMYFITICTKDFIPWFGDVIDGEVVLNELGKIVEKYWQEIPIHFENISFIKIVKDIN